MQAGQNSQTVGALSDPVIPPPPTVLIGREEDLAHIKSRLAGVGNAALTVLHGLPGVGKTALATTLVYDLDIRAHFTDGFLWAGLGPSPNLMSVLSRWGQLLGLGAAQMADLRGDEAWAFALRAAIGTRKILLVIDDVWSIGNVQALRVGGPNCVHLVTTRNLSIAVQLTVDDGAMVIQELNNEQSIQLLGVVAPQVIKGQTRKVQELVQSVGGLPLALTLLGKYLRKQAYNSPARRITAVLDGLREASVRLQISEPEALTSHPSLKGYSSLSLYAVIAVTDQLLTDAARATLYMLSIFSPKPDTFSEEAALTVTASTVNELDALCDVGLLECVGERYTLHQVIADYAHLHLADVQASEAKGRLIASITNCIGTHKEDYEFLDRESSTIRSALSDVLAEAHQPEFVRAVCAFAPFLVLRGFYGLARPLLQRAYDAAVLLDDKEGITGTLLYLGKIEQRLGNYTLALTSIQQGLPLARQLHNLSTICAFLTEWGVVLQEQGNFQQAEAAYQEGLTLARKSADESCICTLLTNLGWLSQRRGDFVQSENYLQEGLALARTLSDRERVGGLLRMLGALENYRGHFVQAQVYLQEGLPLVRALGDREQMCAYLINLGMVAAQQGKNAQARTYFQEGLELARECGHREKVWSVLINLGDVCVEEGDFLQAETYFQEGLELARECSHRDGMSILLLNLGMAERLQGHYDETKRHLEECLAVAQEAAQPRILCVLFCELGNLSLSLGNTESANEYFQRMFEQLSSGDQEMLALANFGLARVCALRGDFGQARIYGDKSMTICEAMEYRSLAEVRDWMKSIFG